MITNLSYNNFNIFRNRLINYSKKYNISHEDLEEIVNDSILKALEFFDDERGSFESLCLVTIKNKIFNFKRDNAFLYLLVLLDENENIFKADLKTIEDKENNLMALNYINELKLKLDEQELKFFNLIYEMCESSDKPNISLVSKKFGIDPLKGWDIFKKIQRKTKKADMDSFEVDSKLFDKDTVFSYSLSTIADFEKKDVENEINYSLIRFLELLPEEDLSRISEMYDY